MFTIQYIENWRSRCANGVVLIYWLVFIMMYTLKTICLARQTGNSSQTPQLILHHVGLALGTLEMALEWLLPTMLRPTETPDSEKESLRETADIFSKLFFSWLSPLMTFGYTETITEKHLTHIRYQDSAKGAGTAFEKAWAKQAHKKNPSLWLALIRAFGVEYCVSAITEVIRIALGLVQPLILQLLIRWVSSRGSSNPQPYSWGAAISFLLFISSAAQAFAEQQNTILTLETGYHIRTAIQVKLYQKALRMSPQARGTKSTGDIVNLMSVDTMKFVILMRLGHVMWSAPLQ